MSDVTMQFKVSGIKDRIEKCVEIDKEHAAVREYLFNIEMDELEAAAELAWKTKGIHEVTEQAKRGAPFFSSSATVKKLVAKAIKDKEAYFKCKYRYNRYSGCSRILKKDPMALTVAKISNTIKSLPDDAVINLSLDVMSYVENAIKNHTRADREIPIETK